MLQLHRAYLKKFILRNFGFYSFCWRLGFQLLEKDLATLSLLNILNGINIANPCPMYTGTRKKFSIFNLKNCILRNFIFYNFSKYIQSQLKLYTKLLKQQRFYERMQSSLFLKKMYFAKFTFYKFCWFSVLRKWLDIFTTAVSMTQYYYNIKAL